MSDPDFIYILKEFKKCDKDAYSVIRWLTEPTLKGGKGIPRPIALEVMFDFAKRIEAGARYGRNGNGLSQLSLAVYDKCVRNKKILDAEIDTKILRILAGQSLTDKQFDRLADDLVEVMNLIYEQVYEMNKRSQTIWNTSLGKLWRTKVKPWFLRHGVEF